MTDYFTGVARRHGFPLAVPSRFDPELYRHQVPGGMISNLRSDLRGMKLEIARTNPRGGRARPHRPRPPDTRQPVRPVRDRAGDAERTRQGTVRDHPGRGRQVRARPLRPPGRRGGPECRRPGVRYRTSEPMGSCREPIAALPRLRESGDRSTPTTTCCSPRSTPTRSSPICSRPADRRHHRNVGRRPAGVPARRLAQRTSRTEDPAGASGLRLRWCAKRCPGCGVFWSPIAARSPYA